eukprot:TRINITY_DN13372_c0_g1_i2.p2 TRINITY_DN13372_c0_g1~~TRINITY_DN13372_c0_g1_i2.p2  ORF type:complete len:162 (-),score=6.57 TRINITY_DN13372_c0_g1_i2:865-1314(-)
MSYKNYNYDVVFLECKKWVTVKEIVNQLTQLQKLCFLNPANGISAFNQINEIFICAAPFSVNKRFPAGEFWVTDEDVKFQQAIIDIKTALNCLQSSQQDLQWPSGLAKEQEQYQIFLCAIQGLLNQLQEGNNVYDQEKFENHFSLQWNR